jgi:hypothetical protein
LGSDDIHCLTDARARNGLTLLDSSLRDDRAGEARAGFGVLLSATHMQRRIQ